MSLAPEFAVHDLQPRDEVLEQEILAGLAKQQKALPAKYFYDERGSQLFEEICTLPEYYPTRTEIHILQTHASKISACLGRHKVLIEFGSGSGRKTKLLLQALAPALYFPVDISRQQLLKATAELSASFPETKITAIVADYTHAFSLPSLGKYGALAKHIFFPGSTVGNFTPLEAREFLRTAHGLAAPGGLLIGVDLKKDKEVLNAAYNDAKGVTAAFNLNLLVRLNREFNADFKIDLFQHHAFYNDEEGRIEMHLISLVEQTVNVAGRRFDFQANETIHTENSYKYGVEEFQEIAVGAGFKPKAIWVDDNALFSVHYLVTD